MNSRCPPPPRLLLRVILAWNFATDWLSYFLVISLQSVHTLLRISSFLTHFPSETELVEFKNKKLVTQYQLMYHVRRKQHRKSINYIFNALTLVFVIYSICEQHTLGSEFHTRVNIMHMSIVLTGISGVFEAYRGLLTTGSPVGARPQACIHNSIGATGP